MLALSHGWSLDDFISQHYCNDLSVSPSSDHQLKRVMAKKHTHNAIERDRRKRVNDLYALLCSLLPSIGDDKKKVSIPRTVSEAVKYIPELQKEVEALIRKKEKLLSFSLLCNSTRKEAIDCKEEHGKDTTVISRGSFVVSSVSVVSNVEVVIQLITSTCYMKKNKKSCSLSEAIQYLEDEEDRLVLLNVTTSKCFGQERFLNTLHFKVEGNQKIDAETLKEKLRSY